MGKTFIKDDTLFDAQGNPFDFFCQDFGADVDSENLEEVVVQNSISRDGLFDVDQLFIVYPKAGIEFMIEQLKKCLTAAS